MARFFAVVKDEFRKNSGDIKLPTRATEHSAGYDFYSPINITIKPNESVMIWSDIKAHMYYDNALIIIPRSSMGKQPIMIANTVGLIDSDYRGETGVGVVNLGQSEYTVRPGDRIAQLMVTPVVQPTVVQVSELDDTGRGAGGFGSTGR